MAVKTAFGAVEHAAFDVKFSFVTDMTFVFIVLVNSAFIAKGEIFCKLEINLFLLLQIRLQILNNRLRLKEISRLTNLTFKTLITFPSTVRHTRNLRILTKRMKSFITFITIQKLILSLSRTTFLAVFAI